MKRIVHDRPLPLYGVEATRKIEEAARAALPPYTLMARAGESAARLAMALAPHARTVWIACGPGNNGGDGLAAAARLQRLGRDVVVTLTADAKRLPADALTALAEAQAAGVRFLDAAPAGMTQNDLCIDALLGIGTKTGNRQLPLSMQSALATLASTESTVLALDLPSGLQADTGSFAPDLIAARARPACANGIFSSHHTLSLLTLKPGLFTAEGRDAAGTVWLDELGVDLGSQPTHTLPTAWLSGPLHEQPRAHASHKGSYGDVAVIGGEAFARRGMGMEGAAVLAASAALHAGAGRVLLATLGETFSLDTAQPELMLRTPAAIDLGSVTTVCGCGGGEAVKEILPRVLSEAVRLVLDADALNAIAADAGLQGLLAGRAARGWQTVLTPHPLEAARLLGQSTGDVQSDRIAAAQALVARFRCTVVVKGSGSIVAAPGRVPHINPTGNGRLATAGTGDVLAGMVGAALALPDADAFDAATSAVFAHGALADAWPPGTTLTAGRLARRSASA